MKVKKFKKVIDEITEVITNPAMEQFGVDEATAEKYVSVLEKAKDLAKENKKLKKQVEELSEENEDLKNALDLADSYSDLEDDEYEME